MIPIDIRWDNLGYVKMLVRAHDSDSTVTLVQCAKGLGTIDGASARVDASSAQIGGTARAVIDARCHDALARRDRPAYLEAAAALVALISAAGTAAASAAISLPATRAKIAGR